MATFGPIRAFVDDIADLSPNFRRIVFTGPDLDSLVTGSCFDQRIKLIFPTSGSLPVIADGENWYREWLEIPENERGVMRTYSMRYLDRKNDQTRISVDFVMHEVDGVSGPAAQWAKNAAVSDEIVIIVPRDGAASGGIEFNSGDADRIVLLGDETAAPAIARILEDLAKEQSTVPCTAYIEVPTNQDCVTIDAAPHHGVTWLPREGALHGSRLAPALGWDVSDDARISAVSPDRAEDDLVWETPAYSSAGESVSDISAPVHGTYYWIAGESGVVKQLRRFLVNEIGVDRSQVAFMGYWREGVSMKG